MATRKRRRAGALFYDDVPADVEYGTYDPGPVIGGSPINTTVLEGSYYRIGQVATVSFRIEWTEDLSGNGGAINMFAPNGWRRIPGSLISTYGFMTVADAAQITAPASYRTLSMRSASDGSSVINFIWVGSADVIALTGAHTASGGTKILSSTFSYLINAADL